MLLRRVLGSQRSRGFTLIELVIVVAIIGILAALVIPQLGDMVAKSQEGATAGNLGALRSALSVYYADTEGVFPLDLNVLTVNQKYISAIPNAVLPAHI